MKRYQLFWFMLVKRINHKSSETTYTGWSENKDKKYWPAKTRERGFLGPKISLYCWQVWDICLITKIFMHISLSIQFLAPFISSQIYSKLHYFAIILHKSNHFTTFAVISLKLVTSNKFKKVKTVFWVDFMMSNRTNNITWKKQLGQNGDI